MLCASRSQAAETMTLNISSSEILDNRGYNPHYPPLIDALTGEILATHAPPEALAADPPRCYSRPNGGYSCVGHITNQGMVAQSHIQLEFSVWNSLQNVFYTTTTALEQIHLFPGERAPYRILVPELQESLAKADVMVRAAFPNMVSEQSIITITDEHGTLTSLRQYRLQATLHNESNQNVENVHLIITLEDDEKQVVGYRLYKLPNGLAEQSMITIDLTITPLTQTSALTHHLTVETE